MQSGIRKIFSVVFIVVFVISLVGCKDSVTDESDNREWNMIKESAENTQVNLIHNFTNVDAVKFLEKTLPAKLKDDLEISLKVDYKSETEIYKKLLKDYKAENQIGEMDIILLENASLQNFYDSSLLYGAFLDKLPNFYNYIDLENEETHIYKGVPLRYSAAPFGREQLVLILNEDIIDEKPLDFDELFKYVKANKGKFSVPSPPDQLGVRFIETLVMNLDGKDVIETLKPDKEYIEKHIPNSIEYMKQLKPYLWKEGDIFPANQKDLDSMFMDNTLVFSMSMDQNHAMKMLYEDNYPEGAKAFVLGNGTVGTVSHMMIPFNSDNKSGAMYVINQILTPEIQGLKYNPRTWGNLPSVDTSVMSSEEAKPITKNTVKSSSVKQSVLLDNRLPSVPKEISDILIQIWFEIMG